MNNVKNLILLFVCLAILQACASNSKPTLSPVPVEDRSVRNDNGNIQHHPSSIDDSVKETTADIKGNRDEHLQKHDNTPVIVALLKQADERIDSGDNVNAAATVERALRIEPKNALLWHRLGLIRLQQKNWQQTINLAKKSNSLAAGDYKLQAANWDLIAVANSRAGNTTAANYAAGMAKQLEQSR